MKCRYLRFLAMSVVVLVVWGPQTAHAFQQDYPTGEEGYSVLFTVDGSASARSACVVSISRGLPILGLSINLFRTGVTIVNGMWPQQIPGVEVGQHSTVKVGSVFLFGNVVGVSKTEQYHVVSILIPKDNGVGHVGDAVTELVFKGAQVEVMVDGKHFPSVHLPPAEGLNAALLGCMEYQAAH